MIRRDVAVLASRTSQAPRGFTLVELLVVIAILAVLIGLVIPAVGAARESARSMQCRQNVRDLAVACRAYLNAQGFLPPPGGGLGDPNVSASPSGGWLYQILPFVDQQPLYDLGVGLSGTPWQAAMRARVGTSVPLFNCSSRGSALFIAPPVVAWQTAYPGISYGFDPVPPPPASPPGFLARSDYAGCWSGIMGGGPLGAHLANSKLGNLVQSIFDGQSNTFLCGERYLRTNEYRPEPFTTPTEWVQNRRECNNKGWSVGSEGDVYATVANAAGPQPPIPDTSTNPDCGIDGETLDSRKAGRFGSAHRGVLMAMVDGAVRVVAFDISPTIFSDLGIMDNGSGTVDQLD